MAPKKFLSLTFGRGRHPRAWTRVSPAGRSLCSRFAPKPDPAATLRAEMVARIAEKLKRLGFTPDVVIGHHGRGEFLNVRDACAAARLFRIPLSYARCGCRFRPEFPTDPAFFPRIRAKNAVNLLALTMPGDGQTPTSWQHSAFSDWAAPKLSLLPEGVDLTIFKPDPALKRRPFTLGAITIDPPEKLVTYAARNLEPYRGFHTTMRALPRVPRARRDVRVVMVGGDGVSYGMRPLHGTWRERLQAKLAHKLDLSRVHFPGRIDHQSYIALLQRSDAHVYLTYPFVASGSLREALAIGAPIIASDTPPVTEFIADCRNGLLTNSTSRVIGSTSAASYAPTPQPSRKVRSLLPPIWEREGRRESGC